MIWIDTLYLIHNNWQEVSFCEDTYSVGFQKRLAVLTLYIILCKQGTAKTLGLNFLIKEMSLFCMHVYLV